VPGAAFTTLYVYDLKIDVVSRVGGAGGADPGPDTGQLFSIGGSGVVVPDRLEMGFDISGPTGAGYVTSVIDGLDGVRLLDVDLDTGAMRDVGPISSPDGLSVIDIAVAVPEPSSMALFASAAALTRRSFGGRRRSRSPIPL
jgi:hypothetical protein